MDKSLKVLFLALSIFTTSAFADSFILSAKTGFEYPSPDSISHSGSYLLVKYKDWSFGHENFDPTTFYSNINLTGFERDFVRSLFDAKKRSKLPKWLSVISQELADGLGNKPDTIKQVKVGNAEILSGYDGKKIGLVFVLEDHVIHQITITGTKQHFDTFVKNIKER